MRKSPLLALSFLILLLPSLSAGVRHFGFIYEAPTSPPGAVEMENFMTWQYATSAERSDQLAFRHEFEFGVTDRFQASIYLADWSYQNERRHSALRYADSAVELIYNLSNPVVDPVGLSIYQEIKGGNRLLEWESKLIAQKNLGPLILAYNATLEAVWEGEHLSGRSGEFQQAIGASYELSPRLSFGVELLHEFLFPNWQDEKKLTNLLVGPNISYRRGNWFATIAALAQATDTEGEPDLQVRFIFGVGL
jgi:hypothetical protein